MIAFGFRSFPKPYLTLISLHRDSSRGRCSVRLKSNSSDCRTFSLFFTLPFKEKFGFIATKRSSSSFMVLSSRSCSFRTALVASALSSSLGFAIESRTLCKKPCVKENLLAGVAEEDI